MKFILAKKIEMAQVFDGAGAVHPVTWLLAGPLVVTDVRTHERDGYEAVQVGFEKSKGNFRYSKEFKVDAPQLKQGDAIDVSIFQEGEKMRVTATSKGKGFQGVVKRHGFKGGSRTHGQKHSEREPGSIGSVWPQRVVKGTRMAGRMGGSTITIRNIKILKIIPEKNLMAVEGAVPGHRGTLVAISSM